MNAASLDVVVVSYWCRDLLERCLLSLREHGVEGMRLFVIDNGSRDGTVPMVRERYPEVELIASPDNLGFAKASNLGIRRGSAPYVLALNPDARITEGALCRLLERMEEQPEIGICGCGLRLENGGDDHAAKRAFPTPLGSLGHFTGLGRLKGAPARLAQYRAPGVQSGRVDAVNGAFMLMRRRALDEVGLFDENFWMYMEDLDLCYRFAQAGWLTWYEPEVTVIHVKAGTSGRNRKPRLNYAFHYGMFRFYRKHYAAEHGAALNALVYAGIGCKLILSVGRSAITRRLSPPVRAS